ncbi:hypothetical protein GF312_16835 [Candidatus Poribacteria bacterium]|nr:hypothetical protein [Candidatus Poribacteria bacterium]
MRFLFIVFLIFITILFTVPAYAIINPDTVIGIWLFEEEDADIAEDFSGNEHHGEVIGDVKWVEGKFGKGLEFPGVSGNYVKVPHHQDLNLGIFTIVYWCKMGTTAGWQIPVAKAGGSIRNFDFQTPANGGSVSLYFTQGASQWRGIDATTKITDEKWHHIAGTYDLENLRIYVDGNMENESQYDGPPDAVDKPMTFGDMESAHPMLGILDEVGIFNKALSAKEIQQIMNQGLDYGLNPVSALDKLATKWSEIKNK